MDYVTVASKSNATDFGNLNPARYGVGGCANNNRGLLGGGYCGSAYTDIDHITILTAGNSSDFGDLSPARYKLAGLSGSAS
tara:strand:- start:321 stop:563 length:243 start_codon:yes stop_codon:yes gene_type:complete